MITDMAKIQFIQEDDSIRNSKLDEIRYVINSDINDLLKHHSPYDQDEIDEKLGCLDYLSCLKKRALSLNREVLFTFK